MKGVMEFFGTRLMAYFQATGEIFSLFGETFYWCKEATRKRNLLNIFKQMLEMGVSTLPLAAVVGFFVGMVLALQTGDQLARFGLENLLGSIVGLSLVKELAPVQAAFLLAGRVGAAITAELGTMKVSEEIDALKTMGVSPIRYLSMPRFLAGITMLPILLMYTIAIGVLGGAVVAVTYVGVSPSDYFDNFFDALTVKEVLKSFVKAFFFGGIVAIVGCYKGFVTTGGAEGVGKYTTQSVVLSFMLILIFDYFLTRVMI